MNIRKHWRDWIWLCPLTMTGLALVILYLVGLSIWTGLVTAMLLVCPALILWGAIRTGRR